jgi:phosphoglucosamine mutase
VQGVRAHAGIAFDGDGDRLVMVNHRGEVVDGDQLLYILALGRKAQGQLTGPVVGTLMTNLGLERALLAKGIAFERTQVGDRYVLERLKATGGILGGETSGHMLILDKATTGDALMSALEVLKVMVTQGQTLADLTKGLTKYPQILKNVRTGKRIALDQPHITDAVEQAKQQLAERGRIVLRASGTEPLIRVMVEGEDMQEVTAIAEHLAQVVAQTAA